jgi:hypothetical protein
MTRVQQIGIGLAAMLIIYLLMPTAPRHVMSNAPGLSSAFAPIGGQPVLAALGAPKVNPFGLSVQGPPTITVQQIEAVLAEYNSPAQGHGQEFYNLGQQYGINPAIALAFFIHESGAGSNPAWAGRKDDGTYTHNVGNIICTEGWRCYGRFRDYDNWSQGIADWYKLIDELYIGEWQRTTVDAIIPKYAPASDNNDEAAYIQAVKNLVQQWQGK